jgi:hypothetical protein
VNTADSHRITRFIASARHGLLVTVGLKRTFAKCPTSTPVVLTRSVDIVFIESTVGKPAPMKSYFAF